MAEFYALQPPVAEGKKEIVFGDSRDRRQDLIMVGKLAEKGLPKTVWLDASGEQVLAVVGKRGTGKSFTLGVLLEGLCLKEPNRNLARITTQRGVILFDTLGVFWTMAYKLQPEGPEKMVEQYKNLEGWDFTPIDLNVDVWVPAGSKLDRVDPGFFNTFYVNVSDLTAADWATLLDVDLVTEPRGQLINEAWLRVVQNGWRHGDDFRPPKPEYAIQDLVECIRGDDDIQAQYTDETRRAVVQRLMAYSRYEMMRASGTRLTELIKPGRLSVLLVNRLEDNLRAVVSSVIIRKVMYERMRASFITKRLKTDPTLSEAERKALSEQNSTTLPRTWIAVDEAQNLVPAERKT